MIYKIWFRDNVGVNQWIEVVINNHFKDDCWYYVYSSGERDALSKSTKDILIQFKINNGEAWRGVKLTCSLDTLVGVRDFYESGGSLFVEGILND